VLQKVKFELVGGKTKVLCMDRGSSVNKLARNVPDDQSLIVQNYSLGHYLQKLKETLISL
jgi:hypothetical protein